MKTIKLTALFAGLLFAATSFAQEQPQVVMPKKGITEKVTMVNRKEQPKATKWIYNYVINDEKLKTLFINGEIPSGFPKYNHNISHQENKNIAIQWAQKPENYALLNNEGKKTLETYLNKN
jgi:hypothetical protein